jgi:hypothetical protein
LGVGSVLNPRRSGRRGVASGVGSHPFEIGGSVYLTSGYGGAPFGLSIVTHAVAGPFNLGLVVVRAGNDANIARVKVDLPKQLPSRLTTLQKACPAATFNTNPAGCPAASVVGIAKASTPLLSVGLSGPVYFVSHGGEAFPSLIVVLQGEGVRVDLTGTTFISKAGITSSTFKSVPDVPVNTFELYLPEGKYSALAANGNLCKTASVLKMPSEFVAQNGAVIKQTTKIAVTGCKASKAKTARAHQAKTSRHKHGARTTRVPQTTVGHGRTR